ncbi:MAG: DarT ssDNA thymidine ADP-ribosyltransferase family protein [Betaproteobacteria bacterium]
MPRATMFASMAPRSGDCSIWDDIFAMDWRHPGDRIAYSRHSSRKCAEVLVPRRVEARFVTGAYVMDVAAQARLAALGCTLPILVNPVLFFR